jgi:hypothetical protein
MILGMGARPSVPGRLDPRPAQPLVKWELVLFSQDKVAGLYPAPYHVPSWHVIG